MKKIFITDRIFATVSICGRTLINIALEGITSINDVIRVLSERIQGKIQGTATLVVRNGSQGWSIKRLFRPVSQAEGIQLSLF